VGSGVNESIRKPLLTKFKKLRTIKPPRGAPTESEYVWKSAKLVCEVKYTEITPAGQLRHPVLLRLRDDKPAKECSREALNQELEEVDVGPSKVEKTVHLTNLDKVLWPNDQITKGDMLRYYEAISPQLLPWIEDRPLVLTRYPDGIDGKSFFQKHAPDFPPDWMHIEKTWSESTEREIGYFVANDVGSLMYIANMASIPIHVFHNRRDKTELPGWCVLDLDPKKTPFLHVIKIAKAIHALCKELGLPNFVKTTGSTDLHILLPLKNQFTYEQSRVLGELLARIVVTRMPNVATIARSLNQRQGKVYVDFLQNGQGKTIASAYCIRPLPGAPVSMPIKWSELNNRLKPDSFNIQNAIGRVERWRKNPALEVLEAYVDLVEVLDALSKEYASL
jgi:bifunctional non-homologous end joining protein LigD